MFGRRKKTLLKNRSLFIFAKLFDDERFSDLPGTFRQQTLPDPSCAALFLPLEQLTVSLAFVHQGHPRLSSASIVHKIQKTVKNKQNKTRFILFPVLSGVD